MTNVPSPIFSARGFLAPLQSAILAGLLADFNDAFGGGMNLSLTTPQGQLATTESAILGNVNDTFVYMTNQFNPAFADGRWQDGLAYIYFITRKPAEPTVVQATCTGVAGTVIPAGALAQTADGLVYVATGSGVIGEGGTVVVPFSCSLPGPIVCPAGSLNIIYQTILGWDAIDNLSDGVIGRDTENRADFEARRFASVAKNSNGALPAIRGEVLDVPGVLDAYVIENTSGSPVTINGFTLAAKSLYVAAVGGTDEEVARAIWTKKSPGCDYNGNTTVTVYDTSYAVPQPSYDVKFERPTPLPVAYAVDLATNAFVPADAAAQVQAAIIAAFSGQYATTPRPLIGSEIFASQYYGPVAALGSWVQIKSIKIGSINNPAGTSSTGSIAGTTFTEAGTVTGAFAIGQTLGNDAGTILPGTQIVSGSSPTWTINYSQTVAAAPVYGFLPTRDELQVQIDQTPNISALDIAVTVT